MAYTSFTSEDFYNTPWIGSLPDKVGEVRSYDVAQILKDRKIDPSEVSEILVYGFFTGLGKVDAIPTTRAVYELYTEEAAGSSTRYSQLMNAVFNQPDTVINSANFWIPFSSNGFLNARIPVKWTSENPVIPASANIYKTLAEALEAYMHGTTGVSVFKDLFLLGCRLKK